LSRLFSLKWGVKKTKKGVGFSFMATQLSLLFLNLVKTPKTKNFYGQGCKNTEKRIWFLGSEQGLLHDSDVVRVIEGMVVVRSRTPEKEGRKE